MSEFLILRPDYQALVTEVHSEKDEEPRFNIESGTDNKLNEELINLLEIFDNKLLTHSGLRSEMEEKDQ